MKTIQAKDMTNERWKSFANLRDFLTKKINPQYWDGKDADWVKIKNNYLDKVSLTDNAFSNSYYIIEDNKVIAFIDAFERRGHLDFIFNHYGKVITLDIIKMILNEIKNLLTEKNRTEAFFFTFSERHYEPLFKTGAEIYDEEINLRLLKKDIDFSNLKKIVADNKYISDYELKLFREIPEDIHQKYVDYMYEVNNDKNEFHPKKRRTLDYTMNDLLTRIKDMNDRKFIFYMYMIFDKDEIAAYCSVYVETIDRKPFIQHAGNLTSVRKKYRGKGFAKYLKAKIYLKIQEDYPDYTQILTDTYPWNKYMYRINEEFGFKQYQKGYTFRFTKEYLEKFTNEN
ncbi:MAG: hypothetical protein M3R36_18175 [Bacteroidota bacterium]|nr:hypothetical protein [Bacteroidota bacterium]